MPPKPGATYKSQVGTIIANFERATEEQVEEAVEVYHHEWLRLWGTPKTGKLYKKTKSGKMHRASAPGEPPAVDEGYLRAAFTYKIIRTATGVFAAIGIAAGANIKYATWLEYGSKFMLPRPIWRPALDAVKGRIRAIFGG